MKKFIYLLISIIMLVVIVLKIGEYPKNLPQMFIFSTIAIMSWMGYIWQDLKHTNSEN